MALGRAQCRLGGRPVRRIAGIGGVAFAIALGGCSPVETWRSLSGVDKNDPNPATAPFSGNLAAADASPYPNLASVPPPPARATSTAERQKLAQSLIADRNATAEQAEPPPGAPAAPAKPIAASSVPAGRPVAILAAAPSPRPVADAPPNGPAALPGGNPAANPIQPERRKLGEPAQPVSMDSTMQMPQVRSLPEPETARPPPPPPKLVALRPPPPAVQLAPDALASASPQAAPPAPELAPIGPPPPALKTEPRRAPPATTVATLEIGEASAARDRLDRARIDQVAALYKEQPGTVRVVAYAAAPAGGGDPLALYRAALDHAQMVAKALAEAGIPAGKIQTEASPAAAPAAGASAAARVEIRFLP